MKVNQFSMMQTLDTLQQETKSSTRRPNPEACRLSPLHSSAEAPTSRGGFSAKGRSRIASKTRCQFFRAQRANICYYCMSSQKGQQQLDAKNITIIVAWYRKKTTPVVLRAQLSLKVEMKKKANNVYSSAQSPIPFLA